MGRESFPDALYGVQQVRDMDSSLIAAGIPGYTLMGRAAAAVWTLIRQRWPRVGRLTVLAGGGNNAGDGYLVADLAHRAGWQTRVLTLVDPVRLHGDAASAHRQAVAAGVPVLPWQADVALQGILVDALLGTGGAGAVREPYATVIRALNASALPVVAVDLPSGLDADTGHALGAVVQADVTVTFVALKRGLFTGEAPALVGDLVFDALVPQGPLVAPLTSVCRLTSSNLPRLAPRAATTHKGRCGQLLLIGGDRGTGGAALLMGEMALRAGAGLVTLATREEQVPAALSRHPELMVLAVRSAGQLVPLAAKADVLVVGPGLGQGAWGRSLLSLAAHTGSPQVWDADALNLLAEGVVRLPADAVITPHPGEAARLLQVSTAQVQADRFAAAAELARRYQCSVVLKGAGSLVAAADGRLALCDQGHPAMAGSGLGDLLAGLIGALRGQGLAGFDAACLGVWLHARAGQQLGFRQGRGLLATDLPPVIRQLLEEHSPCLAQQH